MKIPKPLNKAEETLAFQLRIAGIKFDREYKFALPRQFRADFHLIGLNILVEIEGGIWLPKGGRHNRPKGFLNDLEKYRLAALKGYTVLRYPTQDVIAGKAIRDIADFLIQKHGIKVDIV